MFLISALDGGEWSASRPGNLILHQTLLNYRSIQVAVVLLGQPIIISNIKIANCLKLDDENSKVFHTSISPFSMLG